MWNAFHVKPFTNGIIVFSTFNRNKMKYRFNLSVRKEEVINLDLGKNGNKNSFQVKKNCLSQIFKH